MSGHVRALVVIGRPDVRTEAIAEALRAAGCRVVGPLPTPGVPAEPVDAVLVDPAAVEAFDPLEWLDDGAGGLPVYLLAADGVEPPTDAWLGRASGRIGPFDDINEVAKRLAGTPRATGASHGRPSPARGDDLTPREVEVLRLLAMGSRNDEVAKALHISPHTVRTHLQNIHNKLGVNSRLAAVTRARRSGALRSARSPG